MKTNFTDERNILFKLASKGLKYFFIALIGFAIAYVLSAILGVSHIAVMLLPFLANWGFRVGIILSSLMGTAIFFESLR